MTAASQRAIRLPRIHAEAMIAHARQGKPEEICGLVASTPGGQIVATLPVINAAHNKIITYQMDPSDQHRAFKELDRQGWELHGIYHSHPATPAYPSKTDQGMAFDASSDEAWWPTAVYYILSLADPDHPVIRAFSLPDLNTIEEIPVEIVETN
jgi:proteasome lid subunit RPN8/RPN11